MNTLQRTLSVIATLPLLVECSAQWHSFGTVESVSRPGPAEVTLRSGPGVVEIKVLARDLFRVRVFPDTTRIRPPLLLSLRADTSWAVVRSSWTPPAVTVRHAEDRITLSTSALTLEIALAPIRLRFLDPSGAIVNQDHPSKGISWSGDETRIWKVMPAGEHYYGFGEKAGKFERKQTHVAFWNSDIPGYAADTDPLYKSIPFFYGINDGKAYGIFLDNTWRTSFDMGKEAHDQYSFGSESGGMTYYFFYGPSPGAILERFTELVGRMPVPPRWSLGYQQCRWSYAPERRLREIARGFRDNRIPCDVLYLDIDYMEEFKIFTWNRAHFPNPAAMIKDLAADGFRVAVIVDPGIKADSSYQAFRSGLTGNHFLTYPDSSLFIGDVWPGACAFPDFTSSGSRQWWGAQFSDLVAAGIRGWWNDMNEPSVFNVPTKTVDLRVIHNDNGLLTPHAKSHNVYGMQMTRATYEGVRALLPQERPFVLTRATYAGGQRYSAVWTGDNVASWEHLAMALTMCLNLSISGHSFVGADIGGFLGYPGGELFARWLQLGVFTPLMRAHSVIGERNKEPWEYGAEFTAVNRETIGLRYRLLPYIYTVMAQASKTGAPAMRPMIFEFPDDPRFVLEAQQFMFGKDLLVAPVLAQGVTRKDVQLPGGDWYDYWTDSLYEGSRMVTVDAPLTRLPIFARAGAIIPTQQVVQYTDESPIDPLTLNVYLMRDGKSSMTYYEDDGISFAYASGEAMERTVLQVGSPGRIQILVEKPNGLYRPPPRALVVKVVGLSWSPQSVWLGRRPLPRVDSSSRKAGEESWTVQQPTGHLLVQLRDRLEALQVTLER